MPRKMERSVITGNRWEAFLSANRKNVDIKDRKHERKGLLVIPVDELPDVARAAQQLVQFIEQSEDPELKQIQSFWVKFEPGTGEGGIFHQRGGSIRDVSEEDLGELIELVGVLEEMTS